MALAAVSLGQNATNATATSIAMTGGVDIVSGDTVVVFVATGGVNSDPISSVSDGTNTYTRVTGTNVAGDGTTLNGYGSLYWKDNCTAVVNPTITASLNSSRIDRYITAVRISGANMAGSSDIGTSDNTGSTSSPSISSGTLAQADEIIIGALWANGAPTLTEDGNFTNLAGHSFTDNNKVGNFAYRIVAATTSVTYNPTRSNSSGNLIHLATFKAAAGTTASPGGPLHRSKLTRSRLINSRLIG